MIINILIIFVIIFVLVTFILLITKKTYTSPFVDKSGNIIKNSVAEQLYLTLGGIKQWVLLRGRNVNNPILIFLHGGPGVSLQTLFRYFHHDLENHFIVVGWDQRGAGKSYDKSIPKESFKVENFVEDLHELIQYLKKRFKQDKVYILGESWGSLLGTTYAQKYPEDIIAYIGTGQISNTQESEKLGYEFMLAEAKKQNNQKALKQLSKITQPPFSKLEDIKILRKWLMKFGGCLYKQKSYFPWFLKMLKVNEYSWTDLIKFFFGHSMSLKSLHEELFNTNFFISVPELKVPVYFLLGKYDQQVSSKLAKKYFEFLKTPKKELLWFEKSGHNPMFEEPEYFQNAILTIRYNIKFKPLENEDMPIFYKWVKTPHVAKWWQAGTYEDFVENYNPKSKNQNYVFPFIIYINEKTIGYIQYYLADKVDDGWWMKYQGQPAGTVGMDIIIGDSNYIGKGFGTMLVKIFIEKIFKETNASKIIIDPDKENFAAIHCYEKAGFKKVREIDTPAFFDAPPGKSVLMELKK